MSRKPLSKSVRFAIFKRDAFTCQYCGRCPPDVTLEVDHINPVVLGGEDDPLNLVTSCFDCNRDKGAVALTVIPQSLSEAAELAKERAEQMQALADLLQAERERFEDWCWDVAEVLEPGASNGYSTHKLQSVKMFVRRLGFAQTREAAHIAADKHFPGTRRFKYFCGVCWRKLGDAEGT